MPDIHCEACGGTWHSPPSVIPAVRREVAKWLAEELGAVEAINLDGGPEATLSLKGESAQDSIGTLGIGLPMVLVVLPR